MVTLYEKKTLSLDSYGNASENRFAREIGPRLISSALSVIYLFLFINIYRDYLSVEWSYMRFFYSEMSNTQNVYIYVSVIISTFFLPTNINTPSSVILWLLTMFVLIPTLPITFMIGQQPHLYYYLSLSVLTFIIVVANILSSNVSREFKKDIEPKFSPDSGMIYAFSVIFFIMFIMQYFVFSSILSFASIEDTYFQRADAADAGNGIIAYVRTYFTYVFSSFFIVLGIVYKKYKYYFFLGLLGYLFTYLIDASKIALVIPIAICGFFVVIRMFNGKVYVLTASMAILTFLCGLLVSYSTSVKIFADLFLLRSIAIPAQTYALYFDLFGSKGYTWWSNVRFVNQYVDPPAAFAGDPNWPLLGRIVGTEYYGVQSDLNANANLFAGEGVAAAGTLGIFVIGIALIMWLFALDRLSRKWDRTFIVLLCLPMGMGLTNVHLSTLLLSFGGLFWLVFFYCYRPNTQLRPLEF